MAAKPARPKPFVASRAGSRVGKDVDRAAADTTKVVVYYSDEAGERVAHYFKRVS